MRWSKSLAVTVGVLALALATPANAGRVHYLQSDSGIVASEAFYLLDRAGNLWVVDDNCPTGEITWCLYPIPGDGTWPVPVSDMEWWLLNTIVTKDGIGWLARTGFWATSGQLPGFPVGVPPSTPATHERGLAAPNPFVQATTINFETGQPLGDAIVSIYSADGRLVREIRIGTVAVERFAVTWDGRDADGGHVAPGVYLATLRAADGFEATAKITLAP